jgi:hypothetical protein
MKLGDSILQRVEGFRSANGSLLVRLAGNRFLAGVGQFDQT